MFNNGRYDTERAKMIYRPRVCALMGVLRKDVVEKIYRVCSLMGIITRKEPVEQVWSMSTNGSHNNGVR